MAGLHLFTHSGDPYSISLVIIFASNRKYLVVGIITCLCFSQNVVFKHNSTNIGSVENRTLIQLRNKAGMRPFIQRNPTRFKNFMTLSMLCFPTSTEHFKLPKQKKTTTTKTRFWLNFLYFVIFNRPCDGFRRHPIEE